MRKLICLLLAVLLLPALCVAEEAPAIDLTGEWYAVTLYSRYAWPMAEAVESPEALPVGFADLFGLEAPAFIRLTEDAVLMSEQRTDGLWLALEVDKGPYWMCYARLYPVQALLFEGGWVMPVNGLGAVEELAWGYLLQSLLESGESPEKIVAYGPDAIELRFAGAEEISVSELGMPSVFFVRKNILE